MDIPRITIAGLSGGSGKTILSVGIIAALAGLGKKIAPFKKGPDYIDAGWLALAAASPCYNLDAFMIEKERVRLSFITHSLNRDIAVIEGNRGLYDGIDIKGSTSTAELAKLLKSPVVLCMDCTKATRTMAAVVLGCLKFDPDVQIKGVVLNRVAGPRHEDVLRKSIEYHCGTHVLGAIPKLRKQNFPERHMGLVPMPEHAWAKDSISAISEKVSRYVDLAEIKKIAHDTLKINADLQPTAVNRQPVTNIHHPAPRIGIVKDSAFQFYYPENIEALVSSGAEIVFMSPFLDSQIPPVDAIYIGGGFPETHAQQLAENVTFSRQLKSLADDGLPIYAECGGLMYLGKELVLDGKSYPMANVLPIIFGFSKKPQGHGYTIIEVEKENPYFKKGSEIRGHEFHYSRVSEWTGNDNDLVFCMKKGVGFINKKDGVCYKNVLATYTHIHALGTPSWAEALVGNAAAYQKRKSKKDNSVT
jgi:cobyrinic acid a,c-diamide synthase